MFIFSEFFFFSSTEMSENWHEPRELFAVIKREYAKPTPAIDESLKLIPVHVHKKNQ